MESSDFPAFVSLNRAFRLMDDNRDRKLDLEEMKLGLKEYGATLEDDEVAELFKELDKDESRTVSFEEFLKAVRVSKTKPFITLIYFAQ
ncbi:UNVERIFIED_CONTAM: Capsl [Trichonephila clavipes]